MFFSLLSGLLDVGQSIATDINPLLGAAVGGLRKATGIGQYSCGTNQTPAEVASNHIVNKGAGANLHGGVMRFSLPTETGDVTLSHTEFVSKLYGPTSSDFQNDHYDLNPGLQRAFQWLSSIAGNFTTYEFIQLGFTFKSTVSEFTTTTGTVGTLNFAVQYDFHEEPFQTFQAMSADISFTSVPTTKGLVVGIECDPKKLPLNPGKRFVRIAGLRPEQNQQDFDHARLNVATDGFPDVLFNQPIGELWVSYTVVFRRPNLDAMVGHDISQDLFEQMFLSSEQDCVQINLPSSGSYINDLALSNKGPMFFIEGQSSVTLPAPPAPQVTPLATNFAMIAWDPRETFTQVSPMNSIGCRVRTGNKYVKDSSNTFPINGYPCNGLCLFEYPPSDSDFPVKNFDGDGWIKPTTIPAAAAIGGGGALFWSSYHNVFGTRTNGYAVSIYEGDAVPVCASRLPGAGAAGGGPLYFHPGWADYNGAGTGSEDAFPHQPLIIDFPADFTGDLEITISYRINITGYDYPLAVGQIYPSPSNPDMVCMTRGNVEPIYDMIDGSGVWDTNLPALTGTSVTRNVPCCIRGGVEAPRSGISRTSDWQAFSFKMHVRVAASKGGVDNSLAAIVGGIAVNNSADASTGTIATMRNASLRIAEYNSSFSTSPKEARPLLEDLSSGLPVSIPSTGANFSV